MPNSFVMNGQTWTVYFVSPWDDVLIDRTGKRTVATTDPKRSCVYVSKELNGEFLQRVILHELGHCAMISYNLLDQIHEAVDPRYWVYIEEWICNFIADYGFRIFKSAYRVLGERAWAQIPVEIERLVA